ncbi:unnamed protein product [Alopecurus aequalis]
MMEEKTQADLGGLARLPDVLAVCSSAGWTDQKHMLYLSILQESFVNQLQDGKISFKGLFSLSAGRPSRPKQSSKVDRAESCTKVEQVRPPCRERQEDGEVHSTTDDDASTADSETVQESSCSQANATSPEQSSTTTSHFGKRKHSPSTTAEGSDQNFIDEEVEDTEGSGESTRRRSSNKRLKSAHDTMDDQLGERRCIREDRTRASGLPQCNRREHRWP